MYCFINKFVIYLYFSLVDVQVVPHVKSLHLTLAYQFDVSQKETLKSLIKSTINSSAPPLWEVKLYSREVRAANKQVKTSFINLSVWL